VQGFRVAIDEGTESCGSCGRSTPPTPASW
jgi:hypothetical protein